MKYVENVTTSEKSTREHAARQEAIDNAKVKRNTARAVFEASYESISHALQSKEDRLKPAPPWYSTGINLFGLFKIRDEVKKRTFSKAYGVIFNHVSQKKSCLSGSCSRLQYKQISCGALKICVLKRISIQGIV